MKFVSFFAGIGGIDLGLERAGHECVGQVEINPFSIKVLEKHWPDTWRHDDITTILECPCNPAKTCDNKGEGVNRMAGKLKKMTQEQVAEAINLYQAGLSLQNVAEFYCVTRQAMWDLLRRRIELRPQKRTGQANHFYRGGPTAHGRAQNLAEYAVRKGILSRPSDCSECGERQPFADGRSGIQAHHDDYNKPLEVRWLCQKCHHEWHKTNKATEKEEEGTLPSADLWTAGFP